MDISLWSLRCARLNPKLIIMFERPIKIGDRLGIANVEGTVSLSERCTTIDLNFAIGEGLRSHDPYGLTIAALYGLRRTAWALLERAHG